MSGIFEIRKRYKESFTEKHGVSLGLMSFFVRAAVLALQEYEAVNASLDGDDFVYHDYVHMGIAVSTERGPVVPVLKHTEQMSFAEFESEIKRIAFAARDGKLGINDLSGGTFRSQMGCFRVYAFDPDSEPTANRDSRHARDPGSTDGGRRTGRGKTDYVSGADL